jgi:hypothetical protein
MAWPSTVNTTNLDNASDSPASARADLYSAVVAVNDIIGSRAAASGIASLDASGLVPAAQIPGTLTTSGSADLNLAPDSDRVNITYIVNLGPRSVSQLTGLTAVEGDIAYCSNGDAGARCLAVYNGTDWKKVVLGATISAT